MKKIAQELVAIARELTARHDRWTIDADDPEEGERIMEDAEAVLEEDMSLGWRDFTVQRGSGYEVEVWINKEPGSRELMKQFEKKMRSYGYRGRIGSSKTAAPVNRDVLRGIQKTHSFIDAAEEELGTFVHDYTQDRDVMQALIKVSGTIQQLRQDVKNLGNSMRGM